MAKRSPEEKLVSQFVEATAHRYFNMSHFVNLADTQDEYVREMLVNLVIAWANINAINYAYGVGRTDIGKMATEVKDVVDNYFPIERPYAQNMQEGIDWQLKNA